MDAVYIITAYVLLDEWHQAYEGAGKYHPKISPAEIGLVAVVAAKYFQNHQVRALWMLSESGYILAARWLSLSRFNRQLHRTDELTGVVLRAPNKTSGRRANR